MNELQEMSKTAMARTRITLFLLLSGLAFFSLTADFSQLWTPYFFGGIVVGIATAILLKLAVNMMSRVAFIPHMGLLAVAIIFALSLPAGAETRALILGMSCVLWSSAIVSQIRLYLTTRRLQSNVLKIDRLRSDNTHNNRGEHGN